MQVTVNVDDINLDDVINQYTDETLAEALIKGLVKRIVKDDGYEGILGRVKQIRDEEIREQLKPIIAEAINNPIAKTNSYGESTGESTTLREIIVKEAQNHLGKRDQSYHARDTRTLLQQMIHAEVEAAFKAELMQAVKDAREAIAKEFGGTVNEVVSAAVSEALRAR